MRRDGRLEPVSWDDALDFVAGRLQQHKDSAAGIAGERLSNEDYFMFQRLFRQGLGNGNIDLADRRLAGGDVVAQVGLGRGSNLKDLKKGDAILVVAADLHEEAPVWWLRVKQAVERGAALIVLNARPTRLDKFARHLLYYAPGGALPAVRELLALAHVDTGNPPADSPAAVAATLMDAENLVVFYGAEGLTYDETDAVARMLGNLLSVKRGEGESASSHAGRVNSGLVPVWSHSNTQGAWDMGIHPAFGPGYVATSAGRDAADIYAGTADGRVSALFVMGADPVSDGLMAGRGKLSFLVVQELFLTETAALADVVLPAQSWAEREGTFTSGERRVQRYYPAIPAMGEARPDWQILAQIGERVGLGKPPFAASLAFKEIARSVSQYKDMDYRTLAHIEPQWPIVGGPDLYFGGTAYDNKQGLGQQWATATDTGAAASFELPIEPPQGISGGGFRIMRIPALYTPGTLIDHTDLLHKRMARPTLYLNALDAVNFADGEPLSVTVGGVTFDVEAAVSESVPTGLGLLGGIPGARPAGFEPAIVSRRPVAEMVAGD